ncbi:replication-relaxation family protein [Frankia sp. CiP3]|uniref:replication-relaxation family protein n=1 Tax=Frankia sp. CiP3 TaxID=2880971 RepID=UPI001EF69F81|nr:replication-relaxation family protein [Frankia sp. CiP3]
MSARTPRRRPRRLGGGGPQAALWELACRLTARDRWLLDMLAEHQVLTSAQITRLCFDGERTAQVRLTTLHQLGALDRARPFHGPRMVPYHYTLGPAGAQVLAAGRGVSVRELGYRHDRLLTLAHSTRLAHLVGSNGLFVAWIHTTRALPAGRGLTVWWSEQRAATVWGQYTRPDGYGTWQTAARRLDFHVEYDTGSEPLTRVTGKLPGYARLAAASGIPSPLLIWLPSAARETHLRARLTAHPVHGPVPVITATPDPLAAPRTPHPRTCRRPGPSRPGLATPPRHPPAQPRRSHRPLRHSDPPGKRAAARRRRRAVSPPTPPALRPAMISRIAPTAFAAYGVDGDGDGRADITNPVDAVYSTACYLYVSGAHNSVDLPRGLSEDFPITTKTGPSPAETARWRWVLHRCSGTPRRCLRPPSAGGGCRTDG